MSIREIYQSLNSARYFLGVLCKLFIEDRQTITESYYWEKKTAYFIIETLKKITNTVKIESAKEFETYQLQVIRGFVKDAGTTMDWCQVKETYKKHEIIDNIYDCLINLKIEVDKKLEVHEKAKKSPNATVPEDNAGMKNNETADKEKQ